jgi:hypothetical protein
MNYNIQYIRVSSDSNNHVFSNVVFVYREVLEIFVCGVSVYMLRVGVTLCVRSM